MTEIEGERRPDVLAHALAAGHVVSEDQLARWHRAGLIPRPRQRSLGRGNGTESLYPIGTSVQVIALCELKTNERRLDLIGFLLWWDGFDVDPALVRRVIEASAAEFDLEIRSGGVASPRKKSSIDGFLRRSLGPERVTALMTGVNSPAATAPQFDPADLFGEQPPGKMPSLDELVGGLTQVVRSVIAGKSAVDLISEASDDDLASARDRTKLFLDLLKVVSEPLAWLFGSRGSVFRLIGGIVERLTPSELPGTVAAMLVFQNALPLEIFESLESEPPLVADVKMAREVSSRIPGASSVVTPRAVRAVLWGKEAGKRHRRQFEKFRCSSIETKFRR